jgi:transposase
MEDVETFLITVYVAVDDAYQSHLAPLRCGKPGRPPVFADSEALTVTLAQQLLGIDSERVWLALLRRNWGYLFPHLPTTPEFNRRVRHLMGMLRRLWQVLAGELVLPGDCYRVVDTTALPIVHFQRAHIARVFRGLAAYGRRGARHETYYGFKLALLTTLAGVPLEADLVPANLHDLAAGEAVLARQHDLVTVADKAFLSAPWREALAATRGIVVLTPRQRTQRVQLPRAVSRFLSRVRQIVEIALSHLKDQLWLERHRARTLWGLCTRVYAKLAAYCLAVRVALQQGLPALALKQAVFGT